MAFDDTGKLRLPVAVADDVIDVALVRRVVVKRILGRVEADVVRAMPRGLYASRIALIRFSLDPRRLAGEIDSFGGLVGDLEVGDHGPHCPASALEVAFVEPAARRSFDLAEEMHAAAARPVPGSACRAGAWRGERDRRSGRMPSSMSGPISTPSPTMPSSRTRHGPTISGVSNRLESSVKSARNALVGQVFAVAGDAGERDRQRFALLDGVHARTIGLGGFGGATTGLAVKSNGMPRMSAYSTSNRPFVVELVGLAAQRAADDLLAQKLRAESANAEDMGDSVGVPAFGQHGHRHDAANLLAETPWLADGVHDLAQKVLIRDACRQAVASPARCVISRLNCSISGAASSRKLRSSASPDSSCSLSISSVLGRGETVAVFVVVPEQLEMARVLAYRLAVFALALPARNPFVDELRRGCVVADDDEHRRHSECLRASRLSNIFS